jgi:hypothetical protein
VAGVLFDIGGVLVALDGIPALSRLLGLGESREEIHRRWLACRSVVLHETGRMTADEFAQGIVADLAIDPSPPSPRNGCQTSTCLSLRRLRSNACGTTPTIVCGIPSRRIRCPTASG